VNASLLFAKTMIHSHLLCSIYALPTVEVWVGGEGAGALFFEKLCHSLNPHFAVWILLLKGGGSTFEGGWVHFTFEGGWGSLHFCHNESIRQVYVFLLIVQLFLRCLEIVMVRSLLARSQ
jgi:hypothetical protein